jgi:hypothetical protein
VKGEMFFRPSGASGILLELLTHGLRHVLRSFGRYAGWDDEPWPFARCLLTFLRDFAALRYARS